MDNTQNKSGVGGIIATIIIIAIIILGGLYFWGKRVEEAKLKQDMVSDNTPQSSGQVTNNTSSDDLNTIDADLQSTQTANLGTEMQTNP